MGKLRAVPARSSSGFSFVAPKPSLSGDAGERDAVCIKAEHKPRGNKQQVILTFETDDGEVGRLWVQVQQPLTSTCRYMRLVSLALGHEPKPDTPVHPGTVFEGKRFRVFVGWRTDNNDPETRNYPKTVEGKPPDFLRVHDLLERLQ